MIYYPPSFHRFYDTDSPGRIPFNAGPEAFTNLEAPKFVALPIKRNCTRSENESPQPLAAVGDAVKLLAIATQKAIRKAAGVDSAHLPLDNQTASSNALPQQSGVSEFVDFEAALSQHITALLAEEGGCGSPRSHQRETIKPSLKDIMMSAPPKGGPGRDRDPGAPAFRTVSLFDAIQMKDIANEENDDGAILERPDQRETVIGDIKTHDEESVRSWNQLMSTTMAFLPTKYEWSSLNQLRVFSGAPEKSERGIEKLAYYYSILSSMETKFHLDLSHIKIPFTWYEAFHPEKKVITSCIHYEKASVLFNIAAIYSQLGSSQRLWNKDGKKLAASFFQKSAGVLMYLRDSLWHRFQIKLEHTADLSEETLTAASRLMLAQAVECYYDKANEDRVKSAVTSMIAAQASDYYEVALRQARLNIALISRGRFPKEWISLMNIKYNFFGSVAHFHAPLSLDTEQSVGERISRLTLARNLALKAFKLSKDVGGAVQDLLNSYLSVVTSAHLLADAANFERYHHPSVDARILHPLKRPSEALVFPWPFEATVGDLGRFPDMFGAVMSFAFRSDAASLFTAHLKLIRVGNTDLKSSLFSIERALQELEPELAHDAEGKIGVELRGQITERASRMKGKLEALRKDEVTKSIEGSLETLSQIHEFISSNLQKAMEKLDEITISGKISDASLIDRSRNLRVEIVHLSEQLIVARMAKKTLMEQYAVETSQFDPSEWTPERLDELIIPGDDALATSESEKKRTEEMVSAFERLKKLRDEIEDKMKELGLMENKAIGDLNEIPLGTDILKKMRSHRQELKILEASISEIRARKDSELMRLKQLKESNGASPASEYKEASEIIKSFEKSVDCLYLIRENLKVDLEESSRTREQSIHLVAACHLIHDGREATQEQAQITDPKQQNHPLAAPKNDPIVQEYLVNTKSDDATQNDATTSQQRGIMKKSFNSVAFGKDFTVGSISPDLTTQLEEAASTVQHSANSLDIDGYLKNIAGFQREEIARLSIKYQALEREAKNAAEAERLQRIETARIGNLAQSLFNDASQISAASPSSSMLDLTPRGSITKSSMKEDNIAPMDRMEKLELLKRQQKELLARQADEKATLAAKQVAEHAELMKQHQSLVQKTIPSRRPASKPVRFMGLEEDGKLFDQASSGSVDVLQDPITDPMRKTAPPTTTAWSLSSDKLKKGLFKLVGMSPQPSTTNVAECLKPVDQPTNEAQPFGTVTSRRTSYAANIEMLESKAPIPPSRQPRNGPYRNISTSSAYDTYFDASEQFDAQSRNISQMSGREPNSLQPQPIQKHAGMARGYFDDQLDPQSRSMNNFTSRDSNNLQQLTQKHSGMARLNDVPYEEEEDVPLESMMEPPPHDRAHIAFANLPSFQPQFTLQDSQPEHTVSPTKREKSRNSRPKEQQQYIPQDPSPFSTPFAFNTTPNQPAVFSSRQEEDLKPSLSNWVEEQRKIRPKKPPAPLLSQISLVSSPMDETEDREVFNVPPPPSHPPRFARQVSGGMVAPHLVRQASPKRKPVDTSFLNSGPHFSREMVVGVAMVGEAAAAVEVKTGGKKSKAQKEVRQDSGVAGCDHHQDEEGGRRRSLHDGRDALSRMKMDNDFLVKQLGSLYSGSGGSSDNTYVSSSRKS